VTRGFVVSAFVLLQVFGKDFAKIFLGIYCAQPPKKPETGNFREYWTKLGLINYLFCLDPYLCSLFAHGPDRAPSPFPPPLAFFVPGFLALMVAGCAAHLLAVAFDPGLPALVVVEVACLLHPGAVCGHHPGGPAGAKLEAGYPVVVLGFFPVDLARALFVLSAASDPECPGLAAEKEFVLGRVPADFHHHGAAAASGCHPDGPAGEV
jgi:hypothetical protein